MRMVRGEQRTHNAWRRIQFSSCSCKKPTNFSSLRMVSRVHIGTKTHARQAEARHVSQCRRVTEERKTASVRSEAERTPSTWSRYFKENFIRIIHWFSEWQHFASCCNQDICSRMPRLGLPPLCTHADKDARVCKPFLVRRLHSTGSQSHPHIRAFGLQTVHERFANHSTRSCIQGSMVQLVMSIFKIFSIDFNRNRLKKKSI